MLIAWLLWGGTKCMTQAGSVLCLWISLACERWSTHVWHCQCSKDWIRMLIWVMGSHAANGPSSSAWGSHNSKHKNTWKKRIESGSCMRSRPCLILVKCEEDWTDRCFQRLVASSMVLSPLKISAKSHKQLKMTYVLTCYITVLRWFFARYADSWAPRWIS